MIELKITGCCKNCKYSDLELKNYSIFFDIDAAHRYRIICKNEDVCGTLAKEKEAMKHENIQPS